MEQNGSGLGQFAATARNLQHIRFSNKKKLKKGKKGKKSKTAGKRKGREEESKNRENYKYIFFDFETIVLVDGTHKPVLCISQSLCQRCLENTDVELHTPDKPDSKSTMIDTSQVDIAEQWGKDYSLDSCR